jgi:hypothetical protein
VKWNEQLTAKLKELCHEGKTNAEIADIMRYKLTDVYAKRSQLGITIAKCKGVKANPVFEKALEPVKPKPKGMYKNVNKAFAALNHEILLAMASDWTSLDDCRQYEKLAMSLDALADKYNARIGR